MSVFDGAVKTGRKVKDPGTDRNLPSPGALSYKSIKSVTALAGCTGNDAHIVRGDRWMESLGKHTEHVTGVTKINVDSDQTIKIGGDQKETICGISNETVIGPHLITNMNIFNETRLGAHTQVHGELEWHHDEDGEIHFGLRQYTIYAMTHEIESVHFEFAPFHFEIKGNHNYASGIDANASAFVYQAKAINAEVDVTQADIKGLQGDIQALQGRLGALEGNAHGCVATAGPDPNITPFI